MIFWLDRQLKPLKNAPNTINQNGIDANIITVCAPFTADVDFEIAIQNANGYVLNMRPMTATGQLTDVKDSDGNLFAVWTYNLNSSSAAFAGQLRVQFYAITSAATISSALFKINVLPGVPRLLPDAPEEADYLEIKQAFTSIVEKVYDTEFIPATGWVIEYSTENKTAKVVAYQGSATTKIKIPPYTIHDGEYYTVTEFCFDRDHYTTQELLFSSLSEIIFPETLTSIGIGSGLNTFGNISTRVDKLIIPASVNTLHGQCLPYGIKTLVFMGSNPSIDEYGPINNARGNVNCVVLCPKKYLSNYVLAFGGIDRASDSYDFNINVSYLDEQTIFISEATTLDTRARIVLHKPIKNGSQTYYYIGETTDDYIYACPVHQINATDFIYFNKETLNITSKRIYAVDRLSLSILTTISDYINEYGNVVQSVRFYSGVGPIKGDYLVCAYKEDNKYYAQITSCIDNRRWHLDGAANGSITFNAIMTATYQNDYALENDLTTGLANKVDKSAIKQTTGNSTTDIMSQKAITDLIAEVRDIITITTSTRVSQLKKGSALYAIDNNLYYANVEFIEDLFDVYWLDCRTGIRISGTYEFFDTVSDILLATGNKVGTDSFTDDGQTNKFVTAAEKSTWNGKQNALTFDNTPTSGSNNPVKSGGIYDYVNSSINALAAYYITYNAAGEPFPTKSALTSATTFYSGGVARTPTQNDYAIVLDDESQNHATTRYIYQGVYPSGSWSLQYIVNDTPFTAAQLAAINSGINGDLVTAYSAHIADKNNPHEVSKAQVGLGNVDNTSDLDKPISTAAQTALDAKADKKTTIAGIALSADISAADLTDALSFNYTAQDIEDIVSGT